MCSSPQIQLTDFENAAYVVTIVLLTRAILSFKLNFYIPVTKVCCHLGVQIGHPTLHVRFIFTFNADGREHAPCAEPRCYSP